MPSEFEQSVGRVRRQLFVYCGMLEAGERRTHEELMMSGCLTEADVEFIREHGLRLEVFREDKMTYQARVMNAVGSPCDYTGNVYEPREKIRCPLDEFPAMLHRILLEGRQPIVFLKLPVDVRMTVSRLGDDGTGFVTVFSDTPWNDALWFEGLASADVTFHSYQCDDGVHVCSLEAPVSRLTFLAKRIVHTFLDASTGEIEIEWMEHF